MLLSGRNEDVFMYRRVKPSFYSDYTPFSTLYQLYRDDSSHTIMFPGQKKQVQG